MDAISYTSARANLANTMAHVCNDQSGYWSRRINDEHRIVYKSPNDTILIVQLRYHYGT